MTFIGTDKIKKLVYEKGEASKQARVKLIDGALEIQQNILSLASGIQVISEAIVLAHKVKDETARARLAKIASHTPSDAELSEALNLQLELQAKAGKDAPDPAVIMVPTALRMSLGLMMQQLKSLAGDLKLLADTTESAFDKYCDALSNDFFLDDLKSIGSEGGLINKLHKALVSLKKKELAAVLARPSKRILVEARLLDDSRVAEFLKQWKSMCAEDIIEETTGKVTSGTLISSGPKKGYLEFQTQVGEVGGHSIVITDDTNTITLKYNDECDGRLTLLEEILQRVGFSVKKAAKSLKAEGPSKPATYATLAKIIPNMVDLDYVDGFHDVSAQVREAAIQGILAGYPVTLRRTTGAATIKTYQQAYEQLTGKKVKKGKAAATAQGSTQAPSGKPTKEGLYPAGTVVWITEGEGYDEETPLNPQKTLYYDDDYLYILSFVTNSQYTKTPSKVTHMMPAGANLPNGATKFKLKNGSWAYTVAPVTKKSSQSKSSAKSAKAVKPLTTPPTGTVKSIDDILEGSDYVIMGGNNAGETVNVVKKLNDNAVLVQLANGKKTGKYWFNLGYK